MNKIRNNSRAAEDLELLLQLQHVKIKVSENFGSSQSSGCKTFHRFFKVKTPEAFKHSYTTIKPEVKNITTRFDLNPTEFGFHVCRFHLIVQEVRFKINS